MSRHELSIKRVLTYLEQNLEQESCLQQLADIACYSSFHFHRLFKAWVGEGVYAYKKRLLLERAVKQLCYSSDSITNIALDAGYQNQASFNKAFQKQFSTTPSQVRQSRRQISSLALPIINKEIKMQPVEVINLEAIEVISSRATGPYQQAAEEAWGNIMQFAYSNRLMQKDTRAIGISFDDPNVTQAELIRYEACLTLDADISQHPELQYRTIAAGKYARLLHKGPHQQLPQSYGYLFNQWLVGQEKLELRDEPCFEIYLNRDPRRTKPENLRTEIYLPLI